MRLVLSLCLNGKWCSFTKSHERRTKTNKCVYLKRLLPFKTHQWTHTPSCSHKYSLQQQMWINPPLEIDPVNIPLPPLWAAVLGIDLLISVGLEVRASNRKSGNTEKQTNTLLVLVFFWDLPHLLFWLKHFQITN